MSWFAARVNRTSFIFWEQSYTNQVLQVESVVHPLYVLCTEPTFGCIRAALSSEIRTVLCGPYLPPFDHSSPFSVCPSGLQSLKLSSKNKGPGSFFESCYDIRILFVLKEKRYRHIWPLHSLTLFVSVFWCNIWVFVFWVLYISSFLRNF